MKKKLLFLQRKLADRFPNNAGKVELIDNIFVTKLITVYPALNQYIEIYYYNILGKYEICKYINEKEILSASAKEEKYNEQTSWDFILDTYKAMMVTETKEEEVKEEEEAEEENTNEPELEEPNI